MAADRGRRGRHAPPPTGPTRHVAGLRELLAPWRRRIVAVLLTWLGFVAATALLGLTPDAPRLLTLLVAGFVIAWHVIDHVGSLGRTVWPLVDGDLGSGGRGNDFRVTNLAARLQAADVDGEGREALVHDLHVQLQELIRERLFVRHGLVVEDEPRWSEGVTPPELWQLLVALPPTDLYRPARLDPILRRIEQW
ncbi:hypothetical protein [Intrasporangium sp. YIM S08009]|uniref:hypothetical protein n=1 Tax=Intrasporangium zincisolvens TaxID=3080018 RepID=UPI002B057620|nr:hypothetical protein [Intrasporangium sp. YIM S08009]